MAIPQRNTTITGIFAEDATTTIPTPPVAGTSYRDESMTEQEINKGWPFKNIVDSSQFNQAMYEYSTISKMAEKYGFIPWSNLTDYEAGSLCLGTDGNVYQAVQASGPSSTASNPVNDTANTYWVVWLDNYQLGIGDVKTSVRTANHGNWFLCNGQAISRTIYATLFSIIGTNFGSGDGSTTFNLPDYRGKFLRGLGGDSAADIYTTQTESLPNIEGTFSGVGQALNSAGATLTGAFYRKNVADQPQEGVKISNDGQRDDYFGFDASLSNAIYGASNHVTPVNMAINYFIRVK